MSTAPHAAYPRRFGPYVLLEPLGTGGMGRVALAVSGDQGMETLCVVKRLLPHLRKDAELVARFRDEANLARRLSHGNLVATHAVGQIDGDPFIAQEYVEGHDLADVRSRCSIERISFPHDVAIYIVSQLARGLAYAHDFEDLDLVHRDINPVNIRLSFAGEVKLLDFGLARSKLKTVMTEPGHGLWGKLTYMAPEQIVERAVDRRADLYALGIVLWELLARRPFGTRIEGGQIVLPNETRQEAIDRVLHKAVLPPSRINPEVPAALDEVALKAVARQPAERFQTAADMRAALGPFLPVAANPEAALAKMMARLYDVAAERASRQDLVLSASTVAGDEAREPLVDQHQEALPFRNAPAEHGRGVTLDVESTWLRSESIPPDDIDEPENVSQRKHWGLAIILASAAVVAVVLVALRSANQGSRVALRPRGPTAVQPPPIAQPAATPQPPKPIPESSSAAAIVEALPSSEPPASPPPESARPLDPPPRRARPAPQPRRGSPAAGTVTAAALMDSAEMAFERKSFPEAIRFGRQALDAGAGVEAHVLLGNAYFLSDKMREAEKEYDLALRAVPSDALVRSRLAAVRERLQTNSGQ